jgi:hypothetical protein
VAYAAGSGSLPLGFLWVHEKDEFKAGLDRRLCVLAKAKSVRPKAFVTAHKVIAAR